MQRPGKELTRHGLGLVWPEWCQCEGNGKQRKPWLHDGLVGHVRILNFILRYKGKGKPSEFEAMR